MLKHLFAISCLITLTYCVQIKTKFGDIKGTERKSRDGKTYYAFTGIPYAQPPLGKLRFKNPVPWKDHWKNTYDATKKSPMCLQINVFGYVLKNETVGQDDCLYLSVYTPELKPKEKLAVMVQNHGGAWRCGSEGPRDNADYMMDGNVVLVNVHYRLGILGFLSTEDTLIPGNFGLKDQSLALHWVKDNIHSFGGDGQKITVFGESAGGASANYHMISPLSRNIIKGAISQSGHVNGFWGVSKPGRARQQAGRVAEIVGCGGKSEDELLSCLQNICPHRIAAAELQFLYWDWEPIITFQPVQEPAGTGAFLPFDPLKQETTVPWMTGIVSDEGDFKLVSLLSQGDAITQQFIDNMDEYIIKMLYLEDKASTPKVKATVEKIKERYFPPPLTIQSTLTGLGLFYGDGLFTFTMVDSLRRHKGPAYQYFFGYKGGSSYNDLFVYAGDLGVSHGDELMYLFNYKEEFPKTKPNDEKVSRNMVKLWTNFAKYQKPTLDQDDVEWPLFNSKEQYLYIGCDLMVKRHLEMETMNWWRSLPIFKSDYDKTEL